MKLGILSDTHGRSNLLSAAVRKLSEAGADAFIFCGDVGSESVLEALSGKEVYLVWGNVDEGDRRSLTDCARRLDLKLPEPGEVFELGGRRIALCHGHERGNIEERLVAAGACDFLFCGHTHRRRDERRGTVRVINPGALHRADAKTVALADLETGRVEFLALALTSPKGVGTIHARRATSVCDGPGNIEAGVAE